MEITISSLIIVTLFFCDLTSHSHFVTECCCCWCDVAVDLQTDKTQSSDTWWARCGAWECCLRPGGDTITIKKNWSHNKKDSRYFLILSAESCKSPRVILKSLESMLFFLFYPPLMVCVCIKPSVFPPGQCWYVVTTCVHAPVSSDQGVSHGAGGSVSLISNVRSIISIVTMMSRHIVSVMSWSEHLQWQQCVMGCCHSQSKENYKETTILSIERIGIFHIITESTTRRLLACLILFYGTISI